MQETRLFPPPAEFAAKARIKSLAAYQKLWDEAAADPQRVLGQAGPRRAALVQAVHQGARVEGAVRPVVRRRQDERLVQLPRSQPGGRPRRTGRRSSGKASRATRARSPTPSCTAKSASSPTCSRSWASSAGDVVSIYMPMVPELAIAMLACARIGAVHSVIFAGFSAEAIADRNNDAAGQAADHGRRRLAPRQAAAAEGKRRRGARQVAHGREVHRARPRERSGPHASRAATSGGTS